jgi:hypothetical protein
MKTIITILGFLMSATLVTMIAVLIATINIILNGYHPECGTLDNAIPFMCHIYHI